MNSWHPAQDPQVVRIPFRYEESTLERFQPQREFSPAPFVPRDAVGLSDRCQLILTMQSVGLASRLAAIHGKVAVVGLSGGLDSTLALLVTARAFDRLGLPREGIHALSMPCFGTTSRTKSNAQRIAEELKVSFREVSIEKAVRQHFLDIGQRETDLDVTYENSQARERTQVLMDTANRLGGIVIGTGDLSELALGWATYNGDHMSMYGVNSSIPKTLVRDLVRYVADQLRDMRRFLEAQTGKTVDEAALRAAVARSQRSMDNFSKYMSLRADRQILGDLTGEMFTAMTLHPLLGTEETERYTQACIRLAEGAPPTKEGIRLVWMHTNPFWVKPLREMVDFHAKVQIVGCDMCFEGLIQADPEDPYLAMAQRLVRSAFNGPVTRRIHRGIEAARQLHADGVVWFCHWGCKHTLGGAQLAKKQFEEAGFPCLILDGDGCDRSHGGEGQLMTRLEAFVEMLEREKEEAGT